MAILCTDAGSDFALAYIKAARRLQQTYKDFFISFDRGSKTRRDRSGSSRSAEPAELVMNEIEYREANIMDRRTFMKTAAVGAGALTAASRLGSPAISPRAGAGRPRPAARSRRS